MTNDNGRTRTTKSKADIDVDPLIVKWPLVRDLFHALHSASTSSIKDAAKCLGCAPTTSIEPDKFRVAMILNLRSIERAVQTPGYCRADRLCVSGWIVYLNSVQLRNKRDVRNAVKEYCRTPNPIGLSADLSASVLFGAMWWTDAPDNRTYAAEQAIKMIVTQVSRFLNHIHDKSPSIATPLQSATYLEQCVSDPLLSSTCSLTLSTMDPEALLVSTHEALGNSHYEPGPDGFTEVSYLPRADGGYLEMSVGRFQGEVWTVIGLIHTSRDPWQTLCLSRLDVIPITSATLIEESKVYREASDEELRRFGGAIVSAEGARIIEHGDNHPTPFDSFMAFQVRLLLRP